MSTGWEIGEKARRSLRLLLDEANRFSYDEFVAHVARAVDRCTDADQGEAAQEPVAWISHTSEGNVLDYQKQFDAPRFTPLYTRPPVAWPPPGWVAVPVEPAQEMIRAAFAPNGLTMDGYPNGHSLSDKLRAAIAAAPPCPGVVPLPEVDLAFVEDVLLEYANALTDGALDGAGRFLPADILDAADEIARWIEAQGAEQEQGS